MRNWKTSKLCISTNPGLFIKAYQILKVNPNSIRKRGGGLEYSWMVTNPIRKGDWYILEEGKMRKWMIGSSNFLGRIMKVGCKKPLDLLLLRQIILGLLGSDESELGLDSRPRFTHIRLKPILGAAKEQAQLGELAKEAFDYGLDGYTKL